MNEVDNRSMVTKIGNVLMIVLIGTARYFVGYYQYRKRRAVRKKAWEQYVASRTC